MAKKSSNPYLAAISKGGGDSTPAAGGSDTSNPYMTSLAQLKKRRDKDEQAKYNASELKKTQDDAKAAVNPGKGAVASVLGGVGKVAKGVGNFAVDTVKGVKDDAVGTYQGVTDVVKGELARRDVEKNTQKLTERNQEYHRQFGGATADQWADPEFQKRAQQFSAETKKVANGISPETTKALKKEQEVNAKKLAAEAGSTFLNAATLGEGTALVQGGKAAAKQAVKEGAEVMVKQGAKALAKRSAADAALGAGFGATQTMHDPNASLEDYAKNVALGAAVGGVAPSVVKGAKILKNAGPVKAADKFVSDTAARATRKLADTSVGKTVGNIVEKAQVGLGENLAPIMRDFKGKVDTASGRQINEEVRLLDGNVTNSAAITEGRLKENPAFQALGDLMAPKNTRPGSLRAARQEAKDLGDFISKKQQAINETKLGRKQEVPIGTPKQEKAYDLLNKSTKHDIQYAYDGGLITKPNYEKYMADKDYTRVQRDMGEELKSNFKGVGGAAGSISKANSFTQRLKGGNKDAVDPFVAHFDWSNKVTREVERAKLSNYIIEKRQELGLGKGFLRKADNVEERQASYAEAAQLRVLRNALGKHVKTESRYGRRLQQEVDGLNKQGMNASIKGAGRDVVTESTRKKTVTIKDIGEKIVDNAPKKLDDLKQSYGAKAKLVKEYGKGPEGIHNMALDIEHNGWDKIRRLTGVSKSSAQSIAEQILKEPTVTGRKILVSEGKAGRDNAKARIDSLVKTSTADLRRIKSKIAVREPKLAAHIDNIIMLKEQHEIAGKAVRELVDIARANGDKITTNKTTIKTLKRGIQEVYEDEPRIVDAINKVGKVELHALLKVAQFPSKVVQRTATALNFVFTASNLVKDQVSSAVLSKNAMATHNPVSFMMGLKEAALKPTARAALRGVGARQTAEKVLKPSQEYEKFLKYVAGSTRTDINRNLRSTARRTYESLGLKNNSPIRKVEDINSATENLTRFQNYYGTYKKALKDGLDPETAQKNAIQAARENSVDFSRTGDWGPILKVFNPFANANIQGSRSLIRAMKERPVGTSLKLATTIMAPMAAATYWNLSDPKRALIYSALPDSDKQNNLIFVMSDGNVLKLPTPPGIKEIGQPIRGMIEAEYGSGNPESFLKTAKSIFADSVNPFGAGDIVPQFTKPIVEAKTNYDFFTGDNIVPDYLKDKDKGDQVFKGTSQTYRDIGDRFGVSPLIAKQIITGYGSSVAEQSISLYDQLRKAGGATGKDGKPIVTDQRNTAQQLQGKFYKDSPDLKQKANQVFYDQYDPTRKQRDKISKEVTLLVKAGKTGEAKRKAADFNETLPGKFSGVEKYGWDDSWDDLLNGLQIKTSESAFNSRYKQ